MVNCERHTSHTFSNSLPLHTLLPSDTQLLQSPKLEDIPEEDVTKLPRGHQPPPIMPGALSPTDNLFIDLQPDDS